MRRTGRLPALLLSVAVALVLFSLRGLPHVWETEDFDSQSIRERWVNICADKVGRIHAAWVRLVLRDGVWDRDLVYGCRDGRQWTQEFVMTLTDFSYQTLRVRADVWGTPHIVFSDGNAIYYATRSSGAWSVEATGYVSSDFRNVSFDLDSQGRVHLAYDSGSLAYAYRDETGWHSVSIPNAPTTVNSVSMAIDLQDYPHIFTQPPLAHCFMDETGWHREAVPGGEDGPCCSAAIDALGAIHVAYVCYGYGLYYAVHDGSDWSTELVKQQSELGGRYYECFVAVAEDGTPHLTFEEDTSGATTRHFERVSGTWQETDLAYPKAQYHEPALALAPGGDPIVVVKGSSDLLCYLDRTPPGLNPPSWAAVPAPVGDSEIFMEVSPCEDYFHEVEYLFEETTGAPGATSSNWQEGNSYADGGLAPGNEYCYRVRARDQSANANETEWSETVCLVLHDVYAPTPDPAEWMETPYLATESSTAMQAVTGTDASGVEYYFEEMSGNPGGDDSGWQDSSSYVDTGLTPGTDYCYRCRTRDKAASRNCGDWSPIICLSSDVTLPSPSPPHIAAFSSTSGGTGVYMAVDACLDPSHVEYYFEETTDHPGGDDSGWQPGVEYTDSGLQESLQYCYRVKARDLSLNHNETGWTETVCYGVPDVSPPTPNPLTFANPPAAAGEGTIVVKATTADDVNGVEYLFEETSGRPGGSASGWQASPDFVDWGLKPNTQYMYRVKARDKSSNHNETDWSQAIAATTTAAPLPSAAPTMSWKGFTHCDDPSYPGPWPELRVELPRFRGQCSA